MPKTLPGALGYRYFRKVTVDIGSIAAGEVEDETVTVKGLRKSAPVHVEFPNLNAGLVPCNEHCSAADTLKFRVYNDTGGAVDPASQEIWVTQF